MRSSASLVLLAILALAALVSVHAYVSCDLEGVTFRDVDNNIVWSDADVSTTYPPTFTTTLSTGIPSSIRLTIGYLEADDFLGSVLTHANNQPITTSPAVPNPSPISFNGLNTQCGQANTIYVTTTYSLTRPGRLDECTYDYFFTFNNPSCSNVRGDPQFAGLRGQSFQVHGIDGAVYALISAPQYEVNSRFEFLTGPRPCPVMPSTGKKSIACWSHPGSYLASIGVLTAAGEKLHFQSGPADFGFALVQINNRDLPLGEVVELAGGLGSVVRNSSHEITLNVGVFRTEIENNDGFVNLRSVLVSPQDWATLSAQQVHGLLGQTWQTRRYGGAVKEIEGEVDDYVIDNDDLFGTSFVYNRFVAL